jgi:hypothetical protein
VHNIFRVTWQVAPLQCPFVWRHCSHCKSSSPFRCSMKFRTNAQKKRIDVWLIYRCAGCEETWNMPVFERGALGDITPEEFQAIAHNDPALAMRYAFDRERLARHGGRVEDSAGFTIRKSRLDGDPRDAAAIEISLVLSLPLQIRLDRLLSRALGLTRSRLVRLHDRGVLQSSKALRAPAADGQSIVIDLADGAVDLELATTIRSRATQPGSS